jgi:TRAP-type C4-dicarboxylate transport system substrate-binding protein
MLCIIASIFMVISVLAFASCSSNSNSNSGSDSGANDNTEDVAAGDTETITLRFASGNPSFDHFYTVVNAAWYEYVNRETNGKIIMEGYYDNTLTPQENALEATKNGIVDVGEVYSAFWGDMFPLWEVFFLPFQYPWPDGYTFHHAVAEMIETHPEFVEQVEAQGVKFVMLHGDGIGQIISTAPLRTFDEFKGKIINAGSNIDKQLFEALGAATEILASADIYDNLAKGVIDATGWSINGTYIFSLQDVAKYMTRIDGSHQAWLYVMNNDVYESIPDEYKYLFDFDISKDFMYLFGYTFAQDDMEDFQRLQDDGMEIIYLSDADKAKVVEAAAPLIDTWKDRINALGYDADTIYDDWKQIVDKYDDGDDFSGSKEQLEALGVEVPEYFE